MSDRHDHEWQLWVPMLDGTGREYRKCRGCVMYQTQEARFSSPQTTED